jgi:hypothetical protein
VIARAPTVVLSGVLPNPPELLAHLDDRGVGVGGDDLLACGRRHPPPSPAAADPFEALVDQFFALPPCSTRNASLARRRDHLLGWWRGAAPGG